VIRKVKKTLYERLLRKGASFAFDPSNNQAQPYNILHKGRVIGHVAGFGRNNPEIDELSATILLLEELDLQDAERLREDLARELSSTQGLRLQAANVHLMIYLCRPYMNNFTTTRMQMWGS
jgi:hypothetical protein